MGFLFLACSCDFLSNENDLISIAEVGEYRFELALKSSSMNPIEMVEISDQILEFNLELARVDGQDLIEYETGPQVQQSRIYYYSFHFKNDVYLEQDQSKWPIALCHFERSFGLKKNRKFNIAVATQGLDKTKSYKVVIDSEMLNTGPVKFHFNPILE